MKPLVDNPVRELTLADLSVGQKGRILHMGEIGRAAALSAAVSQPSDEFASRLYEMGLGEGDMVEVLKKGPFGDPIAVRYHGYVLALRRKDAARVVVDTNV